MVTGTIAKTNGPLLFNVKLQDGRIVYRHINHILWRSTSSASLVSDWLSISDILTEDGPTQPVPDSAPSQPPLYCSTYIEMELIFIT